MALKIAPIIGLAVLAYLQTLFPSKVEFEKLKARLDIDHALPIWNKTEEKAQHQLIY